MDSCQEEGNDGKNELTIFVVRCWLLMDFDHDEIYIQTSRSINFYAGVMMSFPSGTTFTETKIKYQEFYIILLSLSSNDVNN